MARTPSKSLSNQSTALLLSMGLLVAIFMGIVVAVLVSSVGDHIGIVLALPGAIIIGLLFVIDRHLLFFLIILFRSAMDPVLEATKMGSFGLGALLNALVILIALIAIIQRPSPVRATVRKTWLAFLLISFATLFIAPDFVQALKTYLALVSYVAVFALAITLIQTEEDFGRWMRAIFYSSIIPVAYAFVDAATGGFRSAEGFRISSTFSHPNIFAFYLVLMISLSFYFFKAKASYIPLFIRKTLPIYIILLMALLIMTKTRSAWASCFAFFTVYALIYERKYLILVVMLPVIGFFIPEVRDRFTDLLQGNQVINYSKLNSYAWRKLLWQQGISWMEPSHYLFGYGLESFKFRSPDFFTMAGGTNFAAHSVYVQLFFETGALGVGAFIWAHFKLARMLIPFYKANKLMIFTAITFLLEFALNAYSDNMLAYLSFNWYLWFVLGAIFAAGYAKQKFIESPTLPASFEAENLKISHLRHSSSRSVNLRAKI